MTIMKLTWTGRPITKKNSMRIVRSGNKPILLPSKKFLEYQDLVGLQIKADQKIKLNRLCNIACVYYMPTNHRVDLGNLLNATMDILVHYGVLDDDNSNIVGGHDGSRVLYDKDNPRVEIVISELI